MHTIRPTRLEIDLDAICSNYRALRAAAGGSPALAVVKADAYGHGAVPVARALRAAGADMFAVALIEEGIELREAGIEAPILMLGATDGPGALAAAEYGITEVVFTRDALLALEGAAKSLGVHAKAHLKIDTGMNRIGVRTEEELRDLLEAARIDGSGEYRIYWTIIMPMLAPAWSTLMVFSFVSSWNDYFSPLIYINDPALQTLPLALNTVSGGGSSIGRAGAVAAATMLMTIPTVIVFTAAQSKVMQTMVHSGIKG